MMNTGAFLVCLTTLGFAGPLAAASPSSLELLHWKRLPALPEEKGFAGSYAGRNNGVLLVAGGANFPGKPPWEGGTKTWYDRIFVLEDKATAWREAGHLPKPAGYGLSISTPDGILLIGGGDAQTNFRAVWRLRWNGRAPEFESLPPLPLPLAMMAGAQLGRSIYIYGGLEKPDATQASAVFLALDLDHLAAGWRDLEPCPGTGRFLAIAGTDADSFYLFGGARLRADARGKSEREWLRDAWCFTPGQAWKRLADLPRVAVAAPSPAIAAQGNLLILGGDDGAQIDTPPSEHRGFRRDVLVYDPRTDRWSVTGEVPFSLVTTPAIVWPGHVVIPGGEKLPGVRSPEVWSATTP